ncbi:hypothetical protein JTE90_029250 [Oedothorax gibbosus]|uniref:Uncharacterized protein n=1 Tax=Oedothorax gibbosus TaxID=931172 RepID=A0AAV6TUZ0_9ARAC|nr:hypothetical protein JTE90_029250 [Oedothorax gibbosus]
MNSENPLKNCLSSDVHSWPVQISIREKTSSFQAAISRSRCPKLRQVLLSLRTRQTTRGVGHWTMESGQK